MAQSVLSWKSPGINNAANCHITTRAAIIGQFVTQVPDRVAYQVFRYQMGSK